MLKTFSSFVAWMPKLNFKIISQVQMLETMQLCHVAKGHLNVTSHFVINFVIERSPERNLEITLQVLGLTRIDEGRLKQDSINTTKF